MGRAGFVLDDRGAGGFVDTATYEAHETAGFVRRDSEPVTAEGLAAQLAQYDPSLGTVGLELVRQHHFGRRHARELVAAYRAARDGERPRGVDPRHVLEAYADATESVFRLESAARAAEWVAVRHRLDREAAEADRDAALARAGDLAREAAVARDQMTSVRAEIDLILATRAMRWTRPARMLHSRWRAAGR